MFLFFLFLASLFWLLNALNKDYTTTINYPIRFTNFPEDKVLIGDLPKDLTLNVYAHGYMLLRYKFSARKPPLIFNLRSFNLNRISLDEPDRFFILTRHTRDVITNQLGSGIQVQEIIPDTLYFQMSDAAKKMVPVIPDVEVMLEKQLVFKENIYTDPDSILITGPIAILDTLNSVFTQFHQFDRVEKSIQHSITLQSIKYVSFSKRKVTIHIPVERFTQSSIEISVQPINVPDTLVLKTFPDKIRVSFHVGLSNYRNIDESQFTAVIDYLTIGQTLGGKMQVNLIEYPDYISSVQFFPKTVDYIIER